MVKHKKSDLKPVMHYKRDIFPRKAKEQSVINLEQLTVIMDIIDGSFDAEDEKISNGKKIPKKKVKKLKKPISTIQIENNQNITEDHHLQLYVRESEQDIVDSNTGTSFSEKSKKSKPPILLPNTGSLSHFMELEARTDLLCNSSLVDPLGADSFDNFQWVEVKQELPDDIEVCKVTFTELPLKTSCDKQTNVSLIPPDDVVAQDGILPQQDIVPEHHIVPCDQLKQTSVSRAVQSESVETESVLCGDNENVGSDDESDPVESLGQNPSAENSNDSFTGKLGTENTEENSPDKKKRNIPQYCDICGKKLSSKGNLRLHKFKKHNLKVQFTCELCGAKFDSQRELIQHRNSSHRGTDGRFSCDVCSKRFMDYHGFLLHMKTHVDKCKEEEGSDKVCKVCNKAFYDDESLRIHQTLMHSLELREKLKSREKNLICDTCGRRFAFSCLLRDHMNIHTGSKPYLCTKCGKAFSQKSTLKQHTKTHSEVRPFQCSECPQGFYGKGDFVKHMRKHTGERPYICEVCGEKFSRNTHLSIHRRTHTGERPHPCDICGRGFTKRGDVVRHRRVHTGELPFLCQVCGKAFRQSTQCSNHIKSQHPDSPIPVARNPNPLIQSTNL